MRTKRSFKRSLAGAATAGLLACLAGNAYAVDLVTETFEDGLGEGTRYTSNTFNNIGDFFERRVVPPNPTTNFFLTLLNVQGSAFWASEDVKGPFGPGVDGILRLNDLNVTGFTNLRVHLYLATGRVDNRPENTDFLKVQYAIDGDSGGTNLAAGTYTTIGQFVGDNPTNFVGGLMRQDTDLNGDSHSAPDGGISPTLTNTFVEYSFIVGVTGSTLSVQIALDQFGGSEEYAFDSIRITGDASANTAPVLVALEPGNISYTEEDPATPITNTITVSDADVGDNIESATIQISSGNDPSEDELAIVGAPVGITVGVYNPVTGTLPLSGTDTAANYQAALRLVTYINNDLDDPSLQTRTVSFQVDDGEAGSNIPSRDIDITTDILTGTIPHKESFETDGDGERYLTNEFDSAPGLFERVTGQPLSFNDAFTGVDGSWYIASEASSNAANPLNPPDTKGYIKLHDLTATGFTGLEVEVNLALSRSGEARWDGDDFVEVQYAFDGNIGTAENDGTYTTIGRFLGDGIGAELRQDLPLDGTYDAGNAALTAAFTPFTFSIPDTGNVLSVRVVIESDGSEELGVDCIEVTGTAAAVLPPAPAAPNGFVAPKIVRNAVPGGTFIMHGAIDFGDKTAVLTDPTTITYGTQTLTFPTGLTPNRGAVKRSYSFLSADRKQRILIRVPRGGSSRGRIAIIERMWNDTLPAAGGGSSLTVDVDIGAFSVDSEVIVDPTGKFTEGLDESIEPLRAPSRMVLKITGTSNDSGQLTMTFAGDGVKPAVAPAIVVRMGEPGSQFEVAIPSGGPYITQSNIFGYRYRIPDPDGTGPLLPTGAWFVDVNFVRRRLRVFFRDVDFGTFPPTSAPVYASLGIDTGGGLVEHAVEVCADNNLPQTILLYR